MAELTAADALETREAFEAAIISQYETEEERAAARQILGSVHGIDFETGMAIEEDEPAKPGEEVADVSKLLPDMGKPAEGDEKPGGEKEETADEKAAREATEAEEARAVVARAKDDRIAELEAEVTLSNADVDIRKAVSDKMADAIAENDALNEAEEARVAKFAEDYGDDAAAELRTTLEANQKLRADVLAKQEEDEVDQARAVAQEEVTAETRMSRDLVAVPDLKAWRDDAIAAKAGTDGKTADMYNIAVAVDASLRGRPEWTDKPQAERFAEVVKMVKLSTGAGSAGAPGAQDTGKKPDTAADIDKEIARKAASAAPPGSLTEIPGGDPGEGDVMAKMENLDYAEVSDLGLTTEQLDRIAERLEDAA